MPTTSQNSMALVGRILLASLFIPAGISKITGFEGTVGYITSAGLPLPQLAAIVAIIVELGGGLAILTGLYTRVAALAVAAFTLVATFGFHRFWDAPAAEQMMQQLNFSKNIAIIGGLLVLAAWGAGQWSLDAKRNS